MTEYEPSKVEWLQQWANVAIKSATLDEALDVWTDADAAADDLIALLHYFYQPPESTEVWMMPDWHRDLLGEAWETVKEWLVVRAAAVTGSIRDATIHELLGDGRELNAALADPDTKWQPGEREEYRRARGAVERAITRRQHALARGRGRKRKRERDEVDSPVPAEDSQQPTAPAFTAVDHPPRPTGLGEQPVSDHLPMSEPGPIPAAAGEESQDPAMPMGAGDNPGDPAPEPPSKRRKPDVPEQPTGAQTRFSRQRGLPDHLQWTLDWLADGGEPEYVIGRVVPTGKDHRVTEPELRQYVQELLAKLGLARRGSSTFDGARQRIQAAVRGGVVVVSNNYKISRIAAAELRNRT